jgi:hypothetical protein
VTDSPGGNFTVTFDPQLGGIGLAAQSAILDTCEADFQALVDIFGNPPPGLPFIVQLTADSGGASHENCSSAQILVGAMTGDPELARYFLLAEEVEVFAAALGNGWDCTQCHGEGLSRVLAQEVCQIALPGSVNVAADWFDRGRPNYIDPSTLSALDQSRNTDLNFAAVGCAVLFLYWLNTQQNKSWSEIVVAGGATLSQIYANLNLGNDAFAQFSGAIDQRLPGGNLPEGTLDSAFWG